MNVDINHLKITRYLAFALTASSDGILYMDFILYKAGMIYENY